MSQSRTDHVTETWEDRLEGPWGIFLIVVMLAITDVTLSYYIMTASIEKVGTHSWVFTDLFPVRSTGEAEAVYTAVDIGKFKTFMLLKSVCLIIASIQIGRWGWFDG